MSKKSFIGFLAAGVLLLFIGGLTAFLVDIKVGIEKGLSEVSGTVESYNYALELIKPTADNPIAPPVKIEIEGDGRVFAVVIDIAFSFAFEDFKRDIASGKIVTITVGKEQKTRWGNIVEIYAFEMDGKEYLTLKQSKKVYAKKRTGGFCGAGVFAFVGIGIISFSIYLLKIQTKLKRKKALRNENTGQNC